MAQSGWGVLSAAVVQERLGLRLPFSGDDVPKPPRLLYLLSPLLTQELPYWPRSVQVGHASSDFLCTTVTCYTTVQQLACGAAVYTTYDMARIISTAAVQAHCEFWT